MLNFYFKKKYLAFIWINRLRLGFTKYLNNTLMEKFRNTLLYKIEDLKF